MTAYSESVTFSNKAITYLQDVFLDNTGDGVEDNFGQLLVPKSSVYVKMPLSLNPSVSTPPFLQDVFLDSTGSPILDPTYAPLVPRQSVKVTESQNLTFSVNTQFAISPKVVFSPNVPLSVNAQEAGIYNQVWPVSIEFSVQVGDLNPGDEVIANVDGELDGQTSETGDAIISSNIVHSMPAIAVGSFDNVWLDQNGNIIRDQTSAPLYTNNSISVVYNTNTAVNVNTGVVFNPHSTLSISSNVQVTTDLQFSLLRNSNISLGFSANAQITFTSVGWQAPASLLSAASESADGNYTTKEYGTLKTSALLLGDGIIISEDNSALSVYTDISHIANSFHLSDTALTANVEVDTQARVVTGEIGSMESNGNIAATENIDYSINTELSVTAIEVGQLILSLFSDAAFGALPIDFVIRTGILHDLSDLASSYSLIIG